jgi:RNA polymerase sigma-70 factor (ECF subfamily)
MSIDAIHPLLCSGSRRGMLNARAVFLSQTHARFDASLRRFFARRGVARDEIADLVQEVYLRLARLPDERAIRTPQAFVFATAANLLRDRFRRLMTRGTEHSVEAGPEIAAEGTDPERAAECDEQLQAVWDVVRALKPATRQVFFGHRMRGQSYAELAVELGVSVSMIEKHMSCAIYALSPLR